jgi:hypothetical protein
MTNFNASNLISQRLQSEEGWQSAEINLSDKQREGFISIFGKRCRSKTIHVLRRAINDNLRGLRGYDIVRRILFEEEGVSYCPGQDYPAEVAFIRKLILKHY